MDTNDNTNNPSGNVKNIVVDSFEATSMTKDLFISIKAVFVPLLLLPIILFLVIINIIIVIPTFILMYCIQRTVNIIYKSTCWLNNKTKILKQMIQKSYCDVFPKSDGNPTNDNDKKDTSISQDKR